MHPLRYSPDSPRPYPTGEDVVEPGTDPVRVWIPSSPLLVLGNSQTPETELDLEAAKADEIPVHQRKGGGGAVFLTEGCVCVALRFRRTDTGGEKRGIHDFFAAGNGLIRAAFLNAFGITLEQRGISDLAYVEERHGRWEERKVAGSSLYLPRDSAVYLASILIDARLDRLDRYLRHPSREPEYRGRRNHADFVTNLADLPQSRSVRITPAAAREAILATATHPEFQELLDKD